MAIEFKKATRHALKLKIGLEGPSGSGKTEGALALATGITEGGRIAVADTENESARFYADRYDFDHVPIADSDARTLVEAINAAVAQKYDALVLDSLSHSWLAILAAKDAYVLDNPKVNSWAAWGLPQFGPKWDKLISHIVRAPIHIVATMRTKQTHELIEREGRKSVQKMGLQPQVRDGTDYEFSVMFTVNVEHRAEATKDRTHLFLPNEIYDLTDKKLHKKLIKWMNTETPATEEQVAALIALIDTGLVPPQVKEVIDKELARGAPSADKVAKWIAQLETHLAQVGLAT